MAVPIEKLLKSVKSYYRLVLVAAQRANELNSGGQPLVVGKSKKGAIIALEEIAKGKVHDSESVAKPAKVKKAKKEAKTKQA